MMQWGEQGFQKKTWVQFLVLPLTSDSSSGSLSSWCHRNLAHVMKRVTVQPDLPRTVLFHACHPSILSSDSFVLDKFLH